MRPAEVDLGRASLPEMRGQEPQELQSALFVLGYTDDLVPEAEMAATPAAARSDFDPDWPTA